jgi:hypothetical protein
MKDKLVRFERASTDLLGESCSCKGDSQEPSGKEAIYG